MITQNQIPYAHKNESCRVDVVVGIVSYANLSALDESGIGCVLVSQADDWIKTIIIEKVLSTRTKNCFKVF